MPWATGIHLSCFHLLSYSWKMPFQLFLVSFSNFSLVCILNLLIPGDLWLPVCTLPLWSDPSYLPVSLFVCRSSLRFFLCWILLLSLIFFLSGIFFHFSFFFVYELPTFLSSFPLYSFLGPTNHCFELMKTHFYEIHNISLTILF